MFNRILDINNASFRWYLLLTALILVINWLPGNLLINLNINTESVVGFMVVSSVLKIYYHIQPYLKSTKKPSLPKFDWNRFLSVRFKNLILSFIFLMILVSQSATQSLVIIFQEIDFSQVVVFGGLTIFSYLVVVVAQTEGYEN